MMCITLFLVHLFHCFSDILETFEKYIRPCISELLASQRGPGKYDRK